MAPPKLQRPAPSPAAVVVPYECTEHVIYIATLLDELAAERAALATSVRLNTEAHQRAVAAEAEAASLRAALEIIADFAPGNGDVCEVIARRCREALAAPSRAEPAGYGPSAEPADTEE